MAGTTSGGDDGPALAESVIQMMLAAARAAAERAYCPYSRFAVGASVLTGDGAITAAANVENASLGLTMCAERNAIFQAVSAGHTRVVAVLVFTPTADPTPPCGACRQVIYEFGPQADVFAFTNGGARRRFKLERLLPSAFGPRSLGK